jgi:hypothetical protein
MALAQRGSWVYPIGRDPLQRLRYSTPGFNLHLQIISEIKHSCYSFSCSNDTQEGASSFLLVFSSYSPSPIMQKSKLGPTDRPCEYLHRAEHQILANLQSSAIPTHVQHDPHPEIHLKAAGAPSKRTLKQVRGLGQYKPTARDIRSGAEVDTVVI